MTTSRLNVHLDRAHERWRDPLLTVLAAMLALMMFVVEPLRAAGIVQSSVPGALFAILIAAALLIVSRSLLPIIAVVAVFGLIGVTLVLRQQGGHDRLDICLEASAWLVTSLVILWVTARAVFGPGEITYHRVIGAVLLYFTVGLVFVALYTFVGVLEPDSFTGLAVRDRRRLLSDLIYFSFVTLTTVGFGDVTPVHPLARSLCNIEAVFGQLYPATLLARLVTLELEARR